MSRPDHDEQREDQIEEQPEGQLEELLESQEETVRTGERKMEHVRLCLRENVAGEGISSGLEQLVFKHNPLPEVDFDDIQLASYFLGHQLQAPLLISSMTGGSAGTAQINQRLAAAAEARGWALGLGSIRAAVEKEELAYTFQVRKQAPSIPIIANLGAVQLNYGFGVEQCQRAVDMAEADMLVLHLNSLQEVFQPEGNTNFSGLLSRIEEVCSRLTVPVGVKEVGWGIDGVTAARLFSVGVSFIDVAGAGGTSWSQVEKFRNTDPIKRAAAEAFADWGNPTASCIREVQELEQGAVIGSGGLRNGVDAAKAIALGADLAGFGRSLLGAAVESEELVIERLAQVELELRTVMFGIGVRDIEQLRGTSRLRQRAGRGGL